MDRIQGDPITQLQWSAGTWTLNGAPIGCSTFQTGAVTGPGNVNAADSVNCSPAPNGWHWTVTVPGPYVISYDFNSIPPGFMICGEIFYRAGQRKIFVVVNQHENQIVIRDPSMHVLYTGPLSNFDPAREGFTLISARRCGRTSPYPPGACCDLTTGICTVLSGPECDQLPGHLFLDSGSCSPNPCPQPPPPLGACCFADGACNLEDEAECARLGGAWLGVASSCDPNPCTQPSAACCLGDGTCQLVPEQQCVDLGGQWLGIGSACSPNPCPQPEGACCAADGSCSLMAQGDCEAAGGTWLGSAIACVPNPCPSPVPAERGTWGRLKSIYR